MFVTSGVSSAKRKYVRQTSEVLFLMADSEVLFLNNIEIDDHIVDVLIFLIGIQDGSHARGDPWLTPARRPGFILLI